MKALVQPFPHPFRERGVHSNCAELLFELDGATVVRHRWRYEGGWTRKGLRSEREKHAGPAAARAALDAAVRDILAKGWAALPDWPLPPADWVATRGALPGSTTKDLSAEWSSLPAARARTFPLGKVRLDGNARPESAESLARVALSFETKLPRSWSALLSRFGAGTWAGRLRLSSPARVVRETRRWRASYRDEYRTFFANHDQLLGDRSSQLVILGTSLEGDVVGFLGGEPTRLLLIPRNRKEIEAFSTLAGVFGRYAAVAREVDGTTAPRYKLEP